MNEYQFALALGAAVAVGLSQKIPRATLWIFVAACSFVVSTAYARFGFPYPEAFAIFCDAVPVLMIYHAGQEQWELSLWRIFQAMILVNLLHLLGVIGPRSACIIVLEMLNWAALLVIAGTAIMERARGRGNRAWDRRDGYLCRAHVALRSERKDPPWNKVWTK